MQKKNFNYLFALFVDLSQAFDSINHKKLWKKLEAKGISSKFIMMIMAIYHQAKAKIRTEDGYSKWIEILIGVLQGETISPSLFTIFMDDIVEKLDAESILGIKMATINILILLYADD
jgi:hypothetical protein